MLSQIDISPEQLADFCRRHHIRWLALFGSVLRPDFRPDSDVDVLVEFDPDARLSLMDYIGAMQELSDILQRPVDLVDRDTLKPLIKDSVLASAKVLYEA